MLALVRNQDGSVLVVKKSYRVAEGRERPWGLVGGSVQKDEMLAQAWQREVKEETGLVIERGQLLVVDEVPAEGDYAKGLNHLYDGGTVAGTEIMLAPDLVEYRFVPEHELDLYLTEHSARRTRAALAALPTGVPQLLVRGFPA
ncbi:NUDIX domain-containing protein [Streptomyces sp. SID1121]|uniref:NUDIX domain-containing protein n=1 Tax=Streptomyces sp. SID1121 TaxID=3425888 RepID=UPI004057025C